MNIPTFFEKFNLYKNECLCLYSICNLYSWRYNKLGNLSHIERMMEYQLANAGFTFDYQLINVEDFEGAGETEPRPFFYQVNIVIIYN